MEESKKILLKIHNSYRIVAAVCDKELIGKKLEEGQRQLDLTGSFFKGEEVTKKRLNEEIKRLLAEDATFNIVGEESINFFKEKKLIKEEGIKKIEGIPLALILL